LSAQAAGMAERRHRARLAFSCHLARVPLSD